MPDGITIDIRQIKGLTVKQLETFKNLIEAELLRRKERDGTD